MLEQDYELPVKVSKKQIIAELEAKIATLTKELEQAISYKDSYCKREQDSRSQVEEMHNILDGLPNVMPKDKERGYGENRVSTRLLSWIAAKASI